MNESIAEHPAIQNIIQKYVSIAERVFRQEVESSGIVLTGEMLQSIRAAALERGHGWVEGHVQYDMLLRLKDLKVLRFSTIPPLAPMIRYVEKIGPERFPYVPGYPPGVTPASYSETVTRIAWGLRMHFRREPNLKRGYRGVYNEPLSNRILPLFLHELRQEAGQTALQQFAITFQDR